LLDPLDLHGHNGIYLYLNHGLSGGIVLIPYTG